MDLSALRVDGFTGVPKLIAPELLAEFEATVARLGTALLTRKRKPQRLPDALADALSVGGDYRVRLFSNLKNLDVIGRMCRQVAGRLEEEGFFAWAALTAPLLYPSLRADVPGEETYLLPLHQDYATQCRRAWRFWIPLRDADARNGSMAVVPGSHALGVLEHDVGDPRLPHVVAAQLGGVTPVTLEVAAGDGVLFDPLLVHGSVAGTSDRMKFVLLVQVQDLASIADPDDPDDPLPARLAMAAARDRARDAALPTGKG